MKYQGFALRFQEACFDASLPMAQNELGKHFGVSGTMAWNYLNGEKLPSMKNACAIATDLGVNVEWLLTGRGTKYPVLDTGEPAPVSFAALDAKRLEMALKMAEEQLATFGKTSIRTRAQLIAQLYEVIKSDGTLDAAKFMAITQGNKAAKSSKAANKNTQRKHHGRSKARSA